MPSAEIISPIRTPAGRLKGYNLLVDGASVPYTCDEIKEQIRSGSLTVNGMSISHAGALILNAPLPVHASGSLKAPEQASIIQAIRSPGGRLKGYLLQIGSEDDAQEQYYSCEVIKEKLASNELIISGLALNSAGALITAPAARHSGPTISVPSRELPGSAVSAPAAAQPGSAISASAQGLPDLPVFAPASDLFDLPVFGQDTKEEKKPDLTLMRQMPVFDPLKITSALEPYQINYKTAGRKNGPAKKNVAFVKRRIT